MSGFSDSPSAQPRHRPLCVEVKLWGIYFRGHRKHLLHTLSSYSLNRSAIAIRCPDDESFTCSFTMYDWEKSIKSLLVSNSVHAEIVQVRDGYIIPEPPVRKKVYLVENDLDVLFALNTTLEEAGYDVLLSHCARPLMEEKLPPTDLFILDKCMHDGDGLEICSKLRSRSETRHIPVIMTSAARNGHDQAVAAGVDEFLIKPFDTGHLLRMVSKHTHV